MVSETKVERVWRMGLQIRSREGLGNFEWLPAGPWGLGILCSPGKGQRGVKAGLTKLSFPWGIKSGRLTVCLKLVSLSLSGHLWSQDLRVAFCRRYTASVELCSSSQAATTVLDRTWQPLHSSLVYLGRVRLRDLFLVTSQVIVTHDHYKLGLTQLVRSSNVLGYSLSGLEETLIMKGFYPGFCFQVFWARLKTWGYLELPPKWVRIQADPSMKHSPHSSQSIISIWAPN